MKNLINMGMENLEILPIETLSFQIRKKHLDKMYGYHYKDGHYDTVGDIKPWKLADYIIERYIGKAYNDAYSEYCKKTKWYQKRYWKNNFQNFEDRPYRSNDYIIDDEGLIQRTRNLNKYKGPYNFKSSNFKVELVHKVTGHKKDDFISIYEQIPYEYKYRNNGVLHKGFKNGKLLYYEYGANPLRMKPLYKRYIAQENDFEAVIVEGWIKSFDSKKDYKFKRLKAERAKKSKISIKKQLILASEKSYELILKTEKVKRQEKEANDLKVLAHGFDLQTSFRA